MRVYTRAQEAGVAVGVLIAAQPEIIDDLVFGNAGRKLERPFQPHGLRKMGEQIFGAFHAAGFQHLAAFGIRLRKIAQTLFFRSYIGLILGRGK
jgi:hypothetical protein